jgi:ABC-type amino acid transport substrate-binding protein
MLSLSFVLFAAWYSETAIALRDYPRLAAAGLLSLFGSINVAMPFLLDFARVPADTFHLFLATGVLNSRFGTLAGASHMVVLALVGTYALRGQLRPSGPALLRYLLITAGSTAATLALLALILRILGGGAYEGARVAGELGLLRPPSPGATVLAELPAATTAPGSRTPLLESVRARGRLRVGFVLNQHPFSHWNRQGELVGFDVEMAHALARELGVALELAPVPRAEIVEALEAGRVDVVMAGVLLTTHRASRVVFSASYLAETLAFLVPDHRRSEFAEAEAVRSREGLRLAVPDLPYVREIVEREFPKALVVPLPLGETEESLDLPHQPFDAIVLTAERGSFLTLLHPAYSVVVPQPLQIRLPLAYPVARHDVEAARFLSAWIELKKMDGTVQALYDHWILGRDARARTPRWSILRDVLGFGRSPTAGP